MLFPSCLDGVEQDPRLLCTYLNDLLCVVVAFEPYLNEESVQYKYFQG